MSLQVEVTRAPPTFSRVPNGRVAFSFSFRQVLLSSHKSLIERVSAWLLPTVWLFLLLFDQSNGRPDISRGLHLSSSLPSSSVACVCVNKKRDYRGGVGSKKERNSRTNSTAIFLFSTSWICWVKLCRWSLALPSRFGLVKIKIYKTTSIPLCVCVCTKSAANAERYLVPNFSSSLATLHTLHGCERREVSLRCCIACVGWWNLDTPGPSHAYLFLASLDLFACGCCVVGTRKIKARRWGDFNSGRDGLCINIAQPSPPPEITSKRNIVTLSTDLVNQSGSSPSFPFSLDFFCPMFLKGERDFWMASFYLFCVVSLQTQLVLKAPVGPLLFFFVYLFFSSLSPVAFVVTFHGWNSTLCTVCCCCNTTHTHTEILR